MTEPTTPETRLWTPTGFSRGRVGSCRKRRRAVRQWPLHPAAAGVPRPRSGGAPVGQGAARRRCCSPATSSKRSPTCSTSCRWWRWPSRPSATAAPSPRPNCCAAAIISKVRSAPPARCWSTSCRICCGSASTSSRCRNPVLLKRLEEGRTGGLGLYYQPTAKCRSRRGRNTPGGGVRDQLTQR